MRTTQQNENLVKLAEYLLTLPTDYDRFDMSEYHTGEATGVRDGEEPECGAVACAIGHGPAAGVPVDFAYYHAFSSLDGIGANYRIRWHEYRKNAFTQCRHEADWLFSEVWSSLDNSALGAAKRIILMFQYGITKDMRGILGELKQNTYRNSVSATQDQYQVYDDLIEAADESILDQPENWK